MREIDTILKFIKDNNSLGILHTTKIDSCRTTHEWELDTSNLIDKSSLKLEGRVDTLCREPYQHAYICCRILIIIGKDRYKKDTYDEINVISICGKEEIDMLWTYLLNKRDYDIAKQHKDSKQCALDKLKWYLKR